MAVALFWVALALAQEPAPDDLFQEKVLGAAPAGAVIKFYSIAPVTGRLAFVAKIGGAEAAFIDGKEAVRSPEIYPVHWSPDGKRWACIAKEGNQRLVVADGVRGDPAARVGDLLFSPNGRRFAYVSGDRGRQAAVIDGVRQKDYDEVERPAFSGDGARFGYVARNGESSLIVLDGAESAPTPQSSIFHLEFSPDGKSVACVRHSREGAFLILDDRPSKRYSRVGRPVFSPVGERLAYEADVDGKRVLVVDGKEVAAFETSSSARDSVLFSPDGKHYAWRVESGAGDPAIVIDGRRQDAFSMVAHFPMTFSPDGKRLAYIGREGSTLTAVVDGKLIRVGEVALSPVVFSPDGARTAFVTRDRNHRQCVVVDGKPGPLHDEVRHPVFSPDGSRLAYVARAGTELRRKIFAEAAPAKPAAPELPPPALAPAADPVPPGFRSRIGSGRLFHVNHDPGGHLTFSADGRRIGATGNPGVRIWEADGGKELRWLSQGSGVFAFSPDGRLAASGGRDKKVTVWDLETGRALHVLEGHSNYLTAIAFSPDSKQLVTAPYGPDVHVWDVAGGKELFQLQRHGESVPIAAFSADGKTILTVPVLKKSIFSWSAVDGSLLKELPGVAPALGQFWFSKRSTLAAVVKESFGRAAPVVVIVDLATGKETSSFEVPEGTPDDIAWSGDDRLLAIAAGHETVSIRDQTGRPVRIFQVWRASQVDLSPDGKVLATGSQGFVRLWDVATGKEQTGGRHAGRISSVTYSRDGRTIVSGGEDHTIRVWDAGTGKEIASLDPHANPPRHPVLVAGGRQVVTVDGGKGIRVWEAATGKEVRSIPIAMAASLLAVSPDEKKAALYGHERGGLLMIVDLDSGKTMGEGTAKGLLNERTLENLWKLAYSADGKTIVSAGSGTTVVVWNAETGKPAFRFDAGTKGSNGGPAFSPDGTAIVTGGADGALRFWEAATGKPAGHLQVNTNGVTAFAFSADGSVLATTGWDRTVRFWNWATKKELGAPTAIPAHVNALAFSPDGKDLAVGGADGTILIKAVPPK